MKMYCGYCSKQVDGMHQLFTMGGFANPYGCKECYDKMKRNELHEAMKADFQSKFPRRLDFEREVMNQPHPKTTRYLALKWWRQLSSADKTRLCDLNTETLGIMRWESLTGREIEAIFEAEKLHKSL